MALITRFSRLFTADLHAVLDRLEEPDVLLKQAVRDMEEELARMRSEALGARAEMQRIVQTEADIGRRLTDLDAELDVCFDAGEEALARSLVRRKLETGRRAKALQVRHDTLAERLAELDIAITENDRHLAGMREKIEVFGEQTRATCVAGTGSDETAIGTDEVDVAFLREQQRRIRS